MHNFRLRDILARRDVLGILNRPWVDLCYWRPKKNLTNRLAKRSARVLRADLIVSFYFFGTNQMTQNYLWRSKRSVSVSDFYFIIDNPYGQSHTRGPRHIERWHHEWSFDVETKGIRLTVPGHQGRGSQSIARRVAQTGKKEKIWTHEGEKEDLKWKRRQASKWSNPWDGSLGWSECHPQPTSQDLCLHKKRWGGPHGWVAAK